MPANICFIPMIFCFIVMMFMIFTRMSGRPGPGGFMQGNRGGGGRDSVDAPLEILKKRYAKGEISKSEYDQLRSDLL
jgi:putative membrane protein